MTRRKSVKARSVPTRLVGVIASAADFRQAVSLGTLPDLFELRLDALHPILPELERQLRKLEAPLIITARHPAEGGRNNLSASTRRDLLLRFLPLASYLDIELRSVHHLCDALHTAAARRVKVILSVHELTRALTRPRLEKLLQSAQDHFADIFKIVMRTDTHEEMTRLLDFFDQHQRHLSLSAMGVGAFGQESRVRLARAGSALNYVHLGAAQLSGQLSLIEMHQALGEQ